MIIDKNLIRIDRISKKIMVWYVTRAKYHADFKYDGKDVITEQPVKVIVRKKKNIITSIQFKCDAAGPDTIKVPVNEVVLIREPKILKFGKFNPFMCRSFCTEYMSSDVCVTFTFNMSL